MSQESEASCLKKFGKDAAVLAQNFDKNARECLKKYDQNNNSSEYCEDLASTIKKFVLETIDFSDKFKTAIEDKKQFSIAIEILRQIPTVQKPIYNGAPNIKQSFKESPCSQSSTQKFYNSPDESDEDFDSASQINAHLATPPKSKQNPHEENFDTATQPATPPKPTRTDESEEDFDAATQLATPPRSTKIDKSATQINESPTTRTDDSEEDFDTATQLATSPPVSSVEKNEPATTPPKPTRLYASPDESDEEMIGDVANRVEANKSATPSLDSDATIPCALSDVESSESLTFEVTTSLDRRSLTHQIRFMKLLNLKRKLVLASKRQIKLKVEANQSDSTCSQLKETQKKSLLKVISDFYAKKREITSSSEEDKSTGTIKRRSPKKKRSRAIISSDSDDSDHSGGAKSETTDPKISDLEKEDNCSGDASQSCKKDSEPKADSNSLVSESTEPNSLPKEIPDSLPFSEELEIPETPTESEQGSQPNPETNEESQEKPDGNSQKRTLASPNQDSNLPKKPKLEDSDFQLNSQARDELLNMFKENNQKKFQLNESDRDDLLNMLTAHAAENFGDGECDRDQMAVLVKEFEENSSSGHSQGSDLLDVLHEEAYDEGKDTQVAWDRFHKLLNASDTSDCSSTDSDTTSSSISVIHDRKRVRKKRYTDLCRLNGITKDLIVNITPIDITPYDLPSKEKRSLYNLSSLKRRSHRADANSDGAVLPSRTNRRTLSTSPSPSPSYSSDDDVAGASCSSVFNNLSDDNERERLANEMLDKMRDSSEELSDSESSDVSLFSDEDKPKAKKSKKSDKQTSKSDSSDEEEEKVGVAKKYKGAWRNDPLLKGGFSSSDESDDSVKPKKKHKLLLSSSSDEDSDYKPSKLGSDEELPDKRPKTPENVVVIPTDDEESPGKKGKGRRNIRSLLEDDDLSEATQQAKNAEKERIKRLEERDKEKSLFSQPTQSVECDPLILDASGDHQISIHPKIVKKLKPHQRDGIQFMWDSCYETIKQCENSYKGSGCILAHCMGLGKTLQALALIQALFTHEFTKTKHVLVVCPLSTVSNWRNEVKLAFKDIKTPGVKAYTIENKKDVFDRFDIVHKWTDKGGMLIMGYECFGLLINEKKWEKWGDVDNQRRILGALVNPGPDLVICDEGHLLRNKQTQRTIALNRVKTMRRIVLTGTPLQNNLLEYYYMVHFVKPNLLGTEKEFKTNFVNPIQNGQFEDSTSEDIMIMKKRSHVLHTVLKGTVQRVEDSELKRYLPKLVDQAIFVSLTNLQVDLYNKYLDWTDSKPKVYTKSGDISRKNFLGDIQMLRYICLHPDVVMTANKTRPVIKEQDVIEDDAIEETVSKAVIFKELLKDGVYKTLEMGSKLTVAVALVEEAAKIGDRTLIFSQSYAEMDSLEYFLSATLQYKKNRDYYRMDGMISPEVRTEMCDRFNRPGSTMKVFIMSTKVGGLGLNLTAANRVIIMNVNWNPSYDIQSVFRAFRFGQTKAVFVYRLIAKDTMEEKMYQRVVTKLAIAHRVVDKHQITRHYSAADIQEFYSIRPVINVTRALPMLPEDGILAKLIKKYDIVFKWHEHQSLLANRPEEDLDEQEKNAAWEEYNRKEQEPFMPPPVPYLPNMPGTSDGIHRMRTFGFRTPTVSSLQKHTYEWLKGDVPGEKYVNPFSLLHERRRSRRSPKISQEKVMEQLMEKLTNLENQKNTRKNPTRQVIDLTHQLEDHDDFTVNLDPNDLMFLNDDDDDDDAIEIPDSP